MNKYTFYWTERHELTVEAENEKEAELYREATDHEVSLVSTEHGKTEAICPEHCIEVSDNYPCEKCEREAWEDDQVKSYKEDRGAA